MCSQPTGTTLLPSRHQDTFARDNLPKAEDWPDLVFTLPELGFPDLLNCAERLLDDALAEVGPEKVAIWRGDRAWTYADLSAATNRIANVLVQDCGVVPGNRVLLHGGNSPELFAAWLAIVKVGAIAVATMPMLRARDLKPVIDKAKIGLALSAAACAGELAPLEGEGPLRRIVTFDGPESELEQLMASRSPHFQAVATSQDDVCLIAFTSGTTGEPKATAHFHRDVLAMCETFAKHTFPADSASIFSGTPPIGFTFGLGALLIFPLYFRAAIALPERSTPDGLAQTINDVGVTHLFTAPTAYKQILAHCPPIGLPSLEVCVSAGETLPKATSDAWFERTGVRIIDGIGSTEMIHIFISSTADQVRPGATGKPAPGYSACLLDSNNQEIQGAGWGRLGVRGPTGCRYLADSRQKDYVVNGWNVTGDLYRRDEDGYYWYIARADDMIVSGGYNIAGPEVEAALALHPSVHECAVIGWPDEQRGQIVKAVVVLQPGVIRTADLVKSLQDHVKQTIAPYKYPRIVEIAETLPRTPTGKLRRKSLYPSAQADALGANLSLAGSELRVAG